ncbi:hypothetical protein B9479_005248 [Cryptococcus floricola]|uniref:Uncharacterized protein n=1 Tax=Cryptococcus floricola TaxID=2591691 RepID=A0A5D3ATC1_9TREE|nr:hypothetical protein B9479_005248 [Cryptococcus floricola]
MPYCMLRDPSWFKETSLYIDELHAKGHDTCPASFFLSNAMIANRSLSALNSSAAEGGHSVLNRIKKSFSYMSEDHANRYLWLAVRAMNRTEEAKRLGKEQANRERRTFNLASEEVDAGVALQL